MDANKQVLSLALVLVLATLASTLLVMGLGLRAGILGLAAIACMTLAYRYPRAGLWLFLAYVPFSGTFTYAIGGVFQGSNGRVSYASDYALFHLAKDTLYVAALAAIVVSGQTWQSLAPRAKILIWAISGAIATCLLTLVSSNLPQQLANPRSHALLIGAIGFKALIGYVPLLLCGYYLIRNKQDLWHLNRLFVVVAIVCCGLNFIQYFLLVQGICPGNSVLPPPAATKTTLLARCFVGGSLLYYPEKNLLRLPGTFVAPWQWSWFLIANSFFLYAAHLGDPSRRWRWAAGAGLGAIVVSSFISGQKTAILCVPLILTLLFILNEVKSQQFLLKLGTIAFSVLLFITNVPLVREQVQLLIGRWQYSSPFVFVSKQFKTAIANNIHLFGNGLGGATNAARRLGKTVLIETFYAKLLYEVGWLGMLAFLLAIATLIFLAFRLYRSLKQAPMRRLALCWWLFLLALGCNTYYYPLTVDPVAVYYWFIGGVMLKLPDIEKQSLTADDS
jgi:hypothetical protein